MIRRVWNIFFHWIFSQLHREAGNFKNDIINLWYPISQSKLGQFWYVGGVLEYLGGAYSKTVIGFQIWARFVGVYALWL